MSFDNFYYDTKYQTLYYIIYSFLYDIVNIQLKKKHIILLQQYETEMNSIKNTIVIDCFIILYNITCYKAHIAKFHIKSSL